jgi:hypothetical protein
MNLNLILKYIQLDRTPWTIVDKYELLMELQKVINEMYNINYNTNLPI